MKAIVLLVLKQIGTKILLALAEETVRILSARSDNAINSVDIERIKSVRKGL